MNIELEIADNAGGEIGSLFIHERDLLIREFAFSDDDPQKDESRKLFMIELIQELPEDFYLLAIQSGVAHSDEAAAALCIMADRYIFGRADSYVFRSKTKIHKVEKQRERGKLPMLKFIPE